MRKLKMNVRVSDLPYIINFINKKAPVCSEKIDLTDYTNLQALSKKLFDKNYTLQNSVKKKVGIAIDLNTYGTLLRFYNYCADDFTKPGCEHIKFVFTSFMYDLVNQWDNLPRILQPYAY